MNCYGAKELAAAFRTVRNNTIKIAEEIGEQHYGFRPSPESRSVAETLIHIARLPEIPYELHGVRKLTGLAGLDFMSIAGPIMADEKKPHSKAEIIAMLNKGRDQFAGWLEGLSSDFLEQAVSLPPGAQPASKSRFEMLLGVKEHEMHHRGQLMLIERLLGMVPHLTRDRQAMMARNQAAAAGDKPAGH